MSISTNGAASGALSPSLTMSTAERLVPLYALMSGTAGGASPALLASLQSAAQVADREAAPLPAPAAPAAPEAPRGGADSRQPPGCTAQPAADAAPRAATVSVYA